MSHSAQSLSAIANHCASPGEAPESCTPREQQRTETPEKHGPSFLHCIDDEQIVRIQILIPSHRILPTVHMFSHAPSNTLSSGGWLKIPAISNSLQIILTCFPWNSHLHPRWSPCSVAKSQAVTFLGTNWGSWAQWLHWSQGCHLSITGRCIQSHCQHFHFSSELFLER